MTRKPLTLASIAIPREIPPEITLTDEQMKAGRDVVAWAASKAPAFALTGAAGTGKTTVLLEVKERLRHLRLAWCACTGRAAMRLGQVTRAGTSTLHAKLYLGAERAPDGAVVFERPAPVPDDLDVLVIDEAGMITPAVAETLREWARAGVRMLFVGDPYQLPPIDNDSDFSIFANVRVKAHLSTVMRNAGDVLMAATAIRGGTMPPSTSAFTVTRARDPAQSAAKLYGDGDGRDHVLITWRNELRMRANNLIRYRRFASAADPDVPGLGDLVLAGRSSSEQAVMNGQLFTVESVMRGPFVLDQPMHYVTVTGHGRIFASLAGYKFPMDGAMPRGIDWHGFERAIGIAKLPEPVPLTWGYCLTCHKMQGNEADRVTVFLDRSDPRMRGMTRVSVLPDGSRMMFFHRWLYTAVTRARSRVDVILGA